MILQINKRIKWIDLSKVFGIWLVVLGHMQFTDQIWLDIIYSFHMPLFFFISGFLVKPKSIKSTVITGFNTMIVPYVIYYVLTWGWWFFVSVLRHPELYYDGDFITNVLIKPFIGLLLGVGMDTDYSIMLNCPIWFLICLFFVGLLFSICNKMGSDSILLLLTLLAAASSYILAYYKVDLFFSIDSALMAFPFYVLGYYAKKYYYSSKMIVLFCEHKTLKLVVLLILSLSVLIYLTTINGRVDIDFSNFGANPFLFYVGGGVGVLFSIVLCELTSKVLYNNAIITISNGTILIMGFHVIMTILFFSLLKKFDADFNVATNVLVSIFVLLMFIPIIHIAKKRLPILLGNR